MPTAMIENVLGSYIRARPGNNEQCRRNNPDGKTSKRQAARSRHSRPGLPTVGG